MRMFMQRDMKNEILVLTLTSYSSQAEGVWLALVRPGAARAPTLSLGHKTAPTLSDTFRQWPDSDPTLLTDSPTIRV
jgi:hypothetical protein